MIKILVLYYSSQGSTAAVAQQVARGVHQIPGAEAVLRTVPQMPGDKELMSPHGGAPYATSEDVKSCDGLVLGSPAYFASMASPLQRFFEENVDIWMEHRLVGKPAGVFTSTGSLHGGQETTCIHMITSLLHYGMVIVGVPHTEQALVTSTQGGTPYGATHVSGLSASDVLSVDEIAIAQGLGKRIAAISIKLGGMGHK